MQRKNLLILGLMILFGLAACAGGSGGDVLQIVGTYDYHMLEEDTNNTWDAGTIEFRSDKTYSLLNIYDIVYEGPYEIGAGGTLTTQGAIEWTGTFENADTLSGTWVHEDEQTGTWVAVRQSP
jgi:hypothetical protein